MEVVSLEDSLAEVLTALAHYAAVFRRNRDLPDHLYEAGNPAQAVADAGDMKFEAAGSLNIGYFDEAQVSGTADAAWGCSTTDLSARQRLRTWIFPRAEQDELKETDPSGLSPLGRGKSGGDLGFDPEGFPFNTGQGHVADGDLFHGADPESEKGGHHAHPVSLSWTDSTANRNVSSVTFASSGDPDICRTFGHVRLRLGRNTRLLSQSTPTPCRKKCSTLRS
ncbi:hypothetical protein B0H11DRAFT_1980558 [Mycena galericulata]|nr:hypothetical protein B0H11DRAFT_1980558 [Mycena galericulata]